MRFTALWLLTGLLVGSNVLLQQDVARADTDADKQLRTPNCLRPGSAEETRCCVQETACEALGFAQPDPDANRMPRSRTGGLGGRINRPDLRGDLQAPDCMNPQTEWAARCCREPSVCKKTGFEEPTAEGHTHALASLRTPNCENPRGSRETGCCRSLNSCTVNGYKTPPANNPQRAPRQAPAAAESVEPPTQTKSCDKLHELAMHEFVCCPRNPEGFSESCKQLGFRDP